MAHQVNKRRFRLPIIVWAALIVAALLVANQFTSPTITVSLVKISEQGGWPKDSTGHTKCWDPQGSLYNASPEEKWAKGCGSHP